MREQTRDPLREALDAIAQRIDIGVKAGEFGAGHGGARFVLHVVGGIAREIAHIAAQAREARLQKTRKLWPEQRAERARECTLEIGIEFVGELRELAREPHVTGDLDLAGKVQTRPTELLEGKFRRARERAAHGQIGCTCRRTDFDPARNHGEADADTGAGPDQVYATALERPQPLAQCGFERHGALDQRFECASERGEQRIGSALLRHAPSVAAARYASCMGILAWLKPAEAPRAPTSAGLATFSLALAAFCVLVASVEFVPVLDHANLAFHEAGHLFFSPFGQFLHVLGGTLFQFVFPTATTVSFWRRGRPLAAAACAVWFCENLRYTAFYMADARAQALPLVGGGEHDWTWLFAYFGALEQDTAIAGFFAFLCWAGIASIWIAIVCWWWRGREAGASDARSERIARIAEEARRRAAERRARG